MIAMSSTPFSISSTLPFSLFGEEISNAEPGNRRRETLCAEPAPGAARSQSYPRPSLIDLMWTVELRPDIPPAQPLEECLVVSCNDREYILVVPQNWSIKEVMTGLRSEALKAAI